MKSDLTCPVEIVSVQVNQQEGEEKGQIVCLIDFFNLSAKALDSLQMNIICFASDGERLGGRLVRSAVTAQGREKFSGAFAPEHVDGAVRVEAAVEKVWFKDGVVWRREERNVREYTPNALPKGRELDRLKEVAGEDAAGYAREDDIVWMCVCGRANRTSDDKCLRCERERAQVLRDYSFSAIDSTVGKKERERQLKTQDSLRRSSEETARVMKAERKKQKKRQKRMGCVIGLLFAVAVLLAALRWGVPYAACLIARDRLNQGLAADAKAIYAWVDSVWTGYMDAGAMAEEAERVIIGGLIETGRDETLKEAADRAQALGGEEADVLYERAVLARAALAANGGETDKAETLYRSLTASQAAQTQLDALIYSIADAAQEQVNYPVAIERFASLGDYEDAAARLEECTYLYGRQLMREGQYALACEQLLQVTGMPDAISLIRQCRYAQATELMDAGEYIEAAALFETLGVYEEAETRAKKCRYTAGMSLLGENDLAGAAEQLALADDYEDARERFVDAVFTLGSAALEAQDYAAAIDWLERIENEKDAADALNQAIYAYAQQLEAAGDRAGASLEYARLGDYQDARKHYRAIEYALALEEMETAPASALSRFEDLGDYEDAEEMVLECRYAMAIAASAAGDHERALEQFTALGKYQDSQSRARSSRYALAGQLYAQGEYEQAAARYQECGAYLDAEEQAMRARYAHAAALEAAGEYQQAAEAFAALGSYEDAKLRTAKNEIEWLGAIYNEARMDLELGDYDNVIAALAPYAGLELPERYNAIADMYREACLEGAKELIGDNRPLDAYSLLVRIEGDKQADALLDKYVYRIIGRWKDAQGVEYNFHSDGSCAIAGEELYFGGEGYEIFVGAQPYPTKPGYSVVSLRGQTLTIKSAETGKNIRLTYVGEPTDKAQAPQDEGAQGEE